ncbi:type IV pilus twitching motility protein PilT [Massilia sp. B-10]|nr:type IV pilus twitching motility protein PilT [Massilia sp. B-10]
MIVIGEIRDAETAKEALALAESGPLVLASLHARSTELGLQKMLRLLGNSEAQSQALASALLRASCARPCCHRPRANATTWRPNASLPIRKWCASWNRAAWAKCAR